MSKRLNGTIKRCLSAKQLEDVIAGGAREEFNDVALASGITMWAQLGSSNPAALSKMMEIAKDRAFSVQSISQVCVTLAKKRQPIPQYLMNKIDLKQRANGKQLATLAWSFARLGHRREFEANIKLKILNELQVRGNDFAPRELVTVLWSFATLRDDSVLDLFAREVQGRKTLIGFNSQDFSNTLWSLAVLGADRKPDLVNFLHTNLKELDVTSFSSQTISNSIWGFAKLGKPMPRLLAIEVLRRKSELSMFNLHGLLNMLWAITREKDQLEPGLLELICTEIGNRDLAKLSSKDFTQVAGEFVSLKWTSELAWDKLSAAVMGNALERFTDQDLPIVLWAFAMINRPEVANKFAQTMATKRFDQGFTTQNLCSMFWSLAELRYRDVVLCNRLCDELEHRQVTKGSDLGLIAKSLAVFNLTGRTKLLTQLVLAAGNGNCSQRDLFTILWSCACLDQLSLVRDSALMQRLVTATTEEYSSVEAQTQLHQVAKAWKQTFQTPFPIHSPLAIAAATTTSSRQIRLAALLQTHFPLPGDLEQETIVDGLSVDLFLPKYACVVEMDGPQHFFTNAPHMPIGMTEFKRRLLTQSGYRVYSISASDFTQRSVEERKFKIASLAKEIRNL
ncbi:hypothetical protein BASA81_008319 [Batrachochytrium salamandrivorans]|nr:hypothetical protein BASA81_008319 [Batrachochytrium salamandrivorans]